MKAPWKIISALRACVADRLLEMSTPVCELPIIWSAHPDPADMCDCTCDTGHGQGWVRYTRLVPRPRPAKLPMGSCGAGWSATVEVGVHRCAPTGVGDDRPTMAEKEAYAQAMVKDMRALIAAWECCDWFTDHDVERAAIDVSPLGPQGGCGGVLAVGQIMLPGCSC